MGLVINPEGATIQMEGCITMGLGYALTEEIHFKGGDILDRNFDTYEIPRFSWLPKIETVFVEAAVCRRRAAASRRSSSWARWSPTPSSTPPARGCSSCR